MRTADVLGAASNFREYDLNGAFLPFYPIGVSLASSLIMIITTAGFYMTISEV